TLASRRNHTIKEGEAGQKTIQWIVFSPNIKRFHYDDHSQRDEISWISSTRITTPVD
ncbi:MAG: hypothetical protein ACJAW4_002241, partial [Paracoccaceae bacterium]